MNESIDNLLDGLASDSPDVRQASEAALVQLGASAVPSLIAFVNKWPCPAFTAERGYAVLEKIGSNAVPVLLGMLQKEASWASEVCMALGRLGPKARAALPDLIAKYISP